MQKRIDMFRLAPSVVFPIRKWFEAFLSLDIMIPLAVFVTETDSVVGYSSGTPSNPGGYYQLVPETRSYTNARTINLMNLGACVGTRIFFMERIGVELAVMKYFMHLYPDPNGNVGLPLYFRGALVLKPL